MIILILKSICLALALAFTGTALSGTLMFNAYIKAIGNDVTKGRVTVSGLCNWFLAGLFWAGFYFLCNL